MIMERVNRGVFLYAWMAYRKRDMKRIPLCGFSPFTVLHIEYPAINKIFFHITWVLIALSSALACEKQY